MADNPQSSFHNRLLRALPPSEFEAVRQRLELVELELRAPLAELGRPVEHLYFLESGLASVVVASQEDDEDIEVGHIGYEGVSGTAAVLGALTASTRTFMQVAGHGHRLRFSDYEKIIADHPTVAALMLRYVYTLQMQVACSALANARYNLSECLARWLLMSHDRLQTDDLPLTHEFLSLMIGVRRAGVTGELTNLEGMGVVRATRGRIRILDRDKLLRIAGGCYGQPEAIYNEMIGKPSAALERSGRFI